MLWHNKLWGPPCAGVCSYKIPYFASLVSYSCKNVNKIGLRIGFVYAAIKPLFRHTCQA